MIKRIIYVLAFLSAVILGSSDGIAEQTEDYGKDVELVKSWRFQGNEYSLVKSPVKTMFIHGTVFSVLKKSKNGSEIILRHVVPYDDFMYEPSMDVVACDDFWALVKVEYAPGAYDVGKWYQFTELDLNELKEREQKAEAWDPDRFCRYEENRFDFDFNSKLGLPVKGAGLPPRGGFIHQTWEFSSENGALIARPVGQRIRQLKDVDFYRYDSDKKTWTSHNRDESEKAAPDVPKNGGVDAEPPESSPKIMPCAEAFDWRLVFGAGAAVALAAGTGIFLWRRRRGKKKA